MGKTCAADEISGHQADQDSRTLQNALAEAVIGEDGGDGGAVEDDSVAHDRHPGADHLADIVGGSGVALDAAGALGTAVRADGRKTVADLIVVGIVGVVRLPPSSMVLGRYWVSASERLGQLRLAVMGVLLLP